MKKKILLFSGGFDSVLLEWKIKPDILLYVDMHTKYAQREIEHIKSLPPYYTDRVIIKDLPLGEYEKSDSFLPYRNLILISIALQYAPKVYLGFTGQDNSLDCKEVFINKASSLFRYLNKDNKDRMDWDEKDFSIKAPFKDLTKSEMVRECLNSGMPPEWIQKTRTCYSGDSKKGCGLCLPCWNKAVALLNNDLYYEELFDNPIDMNIFQKSFDFYEKEWGKDKVNQKHYKEVVRAFKMLRQIRK